MGFLWLTHSTHVMLFQLYSMGGGVTSHKGMWAWRHSSDTFEMQSVTQVGPHCSNPDPSIWEKHFQELNGDHT